MALAHPHFISESTHTPSTKPMTSSPLTQDDLKRIAAYKAVEQVESGMIVGLGTGSTAKHAVERIAHLLKLGKLTNIIGIATSTQTYDQALSLGIPLSDLDSHPSVDLSIDGADEVDPELNLVKGRGGSLLREKMIESVSKRFVVVVDESKLVSLIGASKLAMPVEVTPFCWRHSMERLVGLFEDRGCLGEVRRNKCGEIYVTDNGNYVVDLYFEKEIGDLSEASDRMLRLPGVVEHGMFIGLASCVIVAGVNGVTVKSRVIGGGLEVEYFCYSDLRNGF